MPRVTVKSELGVMAAFDQCIELADVHIDTCERDRAMSAMGYDGYDIYVSNDPVPSMSWRTKVVVWRWPLFNLASQIFTAALYVASNMLVLWMLASRLPRCVWFARLRHVQRPANRVRVPWSNSLAGKLAPSHACSSCSGQTQAT